MGDAGFAGAQDAAESPSGEHSLQTHPPWSPTDVWLQGSTSLRNMGGLASASWDGNGRLQIEKQAWAWYSLQDIPGSGGGVGCISSHWLLKALSLGYKGKVVILIHPEDLQTRAREASQVCVRGHGVQDRAQEERTEMLAAHRPLNVTVLPTTP